MNVLQQRQALQNALNSFGLKNVILLEKQYSDKRKKVSKFFLQDGAETISPVLSYENMNSFIMGMGAHKRIK